MRSLYYHIIIIGEPKVNLQRVIDNHSSVISKHLVYNDPGSSEVSPHIHIVLQLNRYIKKIIISQWFKVRFKYIQETTIFAFAYVKASMVRDSICSSFFGGN